MNKILAGFVCAVIVASFMTGILVKETLNQEEITEMREIQKFLLDKSNETPIVNVTVKIPDITVNLTNAISEEKPKKIEKIPEIITAESIGFVITKLYIAPDPDTGIPCLHLWAQSKVPKEKIVIQMTEITPDARKFDSGGFAPHTDKDGWIFLDKQVLSAEGNKIKLDFYYRRTKIAATISSWITNGKAGFEPVCLTTNNPSKYRIRIYNKDYKNGFRFKADTNIPKINNITKRKKVEARLYYISPTRRENVPKDRFTFGLDTYGEINLKERRGPILPAGHYKILFECEGTNCGEMFGFDVVRIRGKVNETSYQIGTNWIKCIWVLPTATA